MQLGFTSLEKRAFYILATRISVHSVPTASEEAVGFQFCQKANIVARPSESKILLLSRDAYCAVRKVKRIQNEMVKDKPKHVRRGCISQVSRQKAVTSSRN